MGAQLMALLVAILLAACSGPGSAPGGHPPAASAVPVLSFVSVPSGSRPHDVFPDADGVVWYTAQPQGKLGRYDPKTRDLKEIPLGQGSYPHGVIIGPDGAPWVTDGGLNAIVRVDSKSLEVKRYPLPGPNANLNTATFDGKGRLWFTGQNGYLGRLDPTTGKMDVWQTPRGRGPYGICTTPDGNVWFVSLAGSYLGKVDIETGEVTVLEPPTPRQGARRVWSDSRGRLWISQWNAGQVGMYDPASGAWKEWKLPGDRPQAYAVYVDDQDFVWLTDFGANTLVRFDPGTERFGSFALSGPGAAIRQLGGRPGEIWGPESGNDKLVRVQLPGR